jgi:hypothetical protein
MMQQDIVRDFSEFVDRTHDPVSDFGVALHLAALLLGQRTVFPEDVIPDRDFPDVVKRAGCAQLLDNMVRQAERTPHRLTESGHMLCADFLARLRFV